MKKGIVEMVIDDVVEHREHEAYKQGLKAAADECDRRALQWHMAKGDQCSGKLAWELSQTARAICLLSDLPSAAGG